MLKLVFVGAQIATIVGVSYAAQADALSHIDYVEPEPLAVLNEEQAQCLAQNIYFESRNESYQGQVAVAHVTMNRLRSPDFPDTVCDVVKQGPLDGSAIRKNRCQFSWYCDGKADVTPVNDTMPEVLAWDTATLIARLVAGGYTHDITEGSTYYHAEYVDPFWSDDYTQVAAIDSHLFYVHY